MVLNLNTRQEVIIIIYTSCNRWRAQAVLKFWNNSFHLIWVEKYLLAKNKILLVHSPLIVVVLLSVTSSKVVAAFRTWVLERSRLFCAVTGAAKPLSEKRRYRSVMEGNVLINVIAVCPTSCEIIIINVLNGRFDSLAIDLQNWFCLSTEAVRSSKECISEKNSVKKLLHK